MKKILTILAVLMVAVSAMADEFTVEKTNFGEFTKNVNYLDYKLGFNTTFEIRCKKYSTSSTDGSLSMSYSDFISMKITGVTIKSLELTFASAETSPSNAANGFVTDSLTTKGVVVSGNKLTYSGSNWGIYLYFKGGTNPNLKLTSIKVKYDDGWTHVKTNPQLFNACKAGKTKIKLDADIDMYNAGFGCKEGTEICGDKGTVVTSGEPYYALKRAAGFADGMKVHHVVLKDREYCMNSLASFITLEEVIFENCKATYKGNVAGIFARYAHNCKFKNVMFMGCSLYGAKDEVGLLAGHMEGCTVEDCCINATCAVYGKGGRVGSYAGEALKDTKITNSRSYAMVLGYGDDLGGFVGRMVDGSVTGCRFYGAVKHCNLSGDTFTQKFTDQLGAFNGAYIMWSVYATLTTVTDLYTYLCAVSATYTDALAVAQGIGSTGGIIPKLINWGLSHSEWVKSCTYFADFSVLLSSGFMVYGIYSAVTTVVDICYSLSGPDNSGGMVGYTENVAFEKCSNYGFIYSLDEHAGGIVGHTEKNTTITSCLNHGAVHGGATTGGIVGTISSGSIKGCMNMGSIACDHTSTAGRIWGKNSNASAQYNGYSSRTSTIADNPSNNIQFSQEDIVSGKAAVYLNTCMGEKIWHQNVGSDHWPNLMSGHYIPTKDSIDTSLSTTVKVTDSSTLTCAMVNPYSDIVLEKDIDYSSSPAVNLSSAYMPFEGTIDGQGHTIANIKYANLGKTSGLFGMEGYWTQIMNVGILGCAKGAKFKNINFKNVRIDIATNTYNLGLFVGKSENCTYDNIHFTGSSRIEKTDGETHIIEKTGGLIGYSQNDSIRNCSMGENCSIFIKTYELDGTGGLVGHGEGTFIDHCWNAASITGKAWGQGGIVGVGANITVQNSVNIGDLNAYGGGAGLVGVIEGNSTLTNCTEKTTVTSKDKQVINGLLVGYVRDNVAGTVRINNCLSFGSFSLENKEESRTGAYIGYISSNAKCEVSHVYYDNIVDGKAESNLSKLLPELNDMTAEERDSVVKSGAITFFLNNNAPSLANDTETSAHWYQSIDNFSFPISTPMPIATAGEVYASVRCDGTTTGYSNKYQSTAAHDPKPDQYGFCEVCGRLCSNSGLDIHIADSISLVHFANMVNRGRDFTGNTVYLDNDINLYNVVFPVIGRYTSTPFRGTFDGQHHRIKYMTLNLAEGGLGFFGTVSGTSTIKNLIIDSSCSVTSAATKNSSTYCGVAGLVGKVNDDIKSLTIENCGNEADITGYQNVAGLLGLGYGNMDAVVNINNCYNTGAIYGENSKDCAAIVGYACRHTNIRNTYNTGSTESGVHYYYAFSGTWEGVATGVNKERGKFDGTIDNCYTTVSWDRTSGVLKVTEAQVKSGELCTVLNEPSLESTGTTVFTQNVKKEKYPIPGTNGLSGISVMHIKTADQLVNFANKVNTKATNYGAYIIDLDNDIDLSGRTDFTGIGTGSNAVPFEGTFNGQGHRIKNWVVTYSDEGGGHGFFRRVTGVNTIIKNLIIDSSCSITSKSETYGTAGIVGFVTSDQGSACNVTIENCGNEAKVTGYGTVSGVLGAAYNNTSTNLTIQNCYNTGAVKATKKDASALTASTNCYRIFTNCYNAGTVSGVTDKHYFYDNSTGSGSVSGCYDVNGSQSGVTLITADQVKSGELCFLLNNPSTDSGTAGTTVFSQDVSTESYPVFGTEGLTGIEETHITDIAGLLSFAAEVSAAKNTKLFNVYLDNDIDLSGRTDFNGISGAGEAPYNFKGTFNGQGHRIKNWTVSNSEGYGLGFFRRVAGANTVIKNLVIDSSCSITSEGKYSGTAGIVGFTQSTSGTPCNITIENCGNEANVSGYNNVAGILGAIYDNDAAVVNINNCYNTGSVSGSDESETGSIVGYARKHTSIRNTWNSGNVGGTTDYLTFAYTGADGFDGTIDNCYTTVSWDKTPNVTIDETAMRLGIMCNDLNTYVEYARSQGASYKYWTQNLEYDSHPYFTESDSVMENGDGVSYSRSLDNKWGTIVLPFNIDLSDNDLPYECFELAAVTGNVVKLTKVTGKLKGGVPALIRMNQSALNAETGKYELSLLSNGSYTENPNDSIIEPVNGLSMKGCFTTTDLTNVSGYALENGYLKLTSTSSSLSPFRAYIAGTLEGNPSMLIIEDSVTISNADELTAFSNAVNAGTDFSGVTVYLLNDIDCSTVSSGTQTPFIAIGNEAHPYKGSFDGLGYRIKNLTLVSDTAEVGFFGVIAGAATIIRNTIIDSSCSVTAAKNAGVAGLVGCVQTVPAICNITIENCGNEATITGVENVAGLVGGVYAYDDTKLKIANCYNTGAINGQKVSAALCGYARKNYTITNCYNSGKVTGMSGSDCLCHGRSGGIASVTNCYDVNGSQNGVEKITADQVRLGYLCQQLNANRGTYRAWTQNIATDTYPTFSSLGESEGALHYSRTMTNKWGTICLPFDVDVNDDDNFEFYELSGVSGDALVLTKVETLEAGKPAIISRSESATGIDINASSAIFAEVPVTGSSAKGLTLTGAFSTKDITSENGYIIANNAFWDIQQVKGSNNVYCAPFRAYLAGSLSSQAKMLSISDLADPTAVAKIDADVNPDFENSAIYDVNGHRLSSLQPGVNIVKFRDGTTQKIVIR